MTNERLAELRMRCFANLLMSDATELFDRIAALEAYQEFADKAMEAYADEIAGWDYTSYLKDLQIAALESQLADFRARWQVTFREWLETDAGKTAADIETLWGHAKATYLENRLHAAFTAGYQASRDDLYRMQRLRENKRRREKRKREKRDKAMLSRTLEKTW